MKNNAYKKTLLALAFSFFTVTGAFAQFSLGLELALPMGDFGDVFNMGFGGSVNYTKPINDNISWTAYAGYQTFSAKDDVVGSGNSLTYSAIPIMGGIKYYFQESGAGLYGELDLGFIFETVSSDIGGFGSSSVSETDFGITPALGYKVSSFDISARYNIVDEANRLAFRIAYVFGGGD